MQRFWNKVEKTDTCWLWTACCFDKGYGQFRLNGRLQRAHRVSYLLTFGVLPDDRDVLHTCDVRKCVNPAHLYLGDDLDNARDREERGRGNHVRGEQHGSAKLTVMAVKKIRCLYASGDFSQEQLRRQFKVSRSAIRDIVSGLKWSHV